MNSKPPRKIITNEEFQEVMRKSMTIEFTDAIFEFPISFIFNKPTTVQHSFSFTNCSFPKIEFQNVVFSNTIQLQSCQIENYFTANNCNFNNSFKAFHISAKRIAFWANNIANGFELYNFENVDELKLQFRKVSKKISIKQWQVNPVELSNIHITFESISECPIRIEHLVSKKVQIQLSGQMLTEPLWIGDIKTNEINFFNIKNKATNKIEIARISSSKIYFIWLHNDGWLSLQEINRQSNIAGSVFEIQDSYLGNAELYNIDLNSFERVQIFNCHIQNIIPVNVKWNFNISAYHGVKAEYLRELFRQLKNVCAKNMDKISQLQFEKMEMLFYSNQLNWKNSFQDWFILKSNQISNNHGLSWVRPLAWLLVLSFVFYTIINYVSCHFECYHVGNYLNFLMPLHNINDILCFKVSESKHKNWINFWDITQRLISGYLIFQFLRAFRKFVS